MRKEFKFLYNRLRDDLTYNIPNKFNINENGEELDLILKIKDTIGINCDFNYINENIELIFESGLTTTQIIELNNLIDFYRNKNNFSESEKLLLEYNSTDKLSSDFNIFLIELEKEYVSTGWGNLSYTDKKIMSKYFISNENERLEVYNENELNEFNYYKLYRYLTDDKSRMLNNIDFNETPKSIDYKKDVTQRLHTEFTFNNFGLLVMVIYYENVDISISPYGTPIYTFINPILKYEANYTTGPDGYVQSRVITRKWMLASGLYSDDFKTSFKIYDTISSRNEAKKRRKNLINSLLVDTVGLILLTTPSLNTGEEAETDAMEFMHDIEGSITAYYESGANLDSNGDECKLITDISTHPYIRLNNFVPGTNDTLTIRSYVISRLKPSFN